MPLRVIGSDVLNACAEMSAPLAKASKTPVIRLGGLYRAPASAPTRAADD